MNPYHTFIITLAIILFARLCWCWGWWAACRQVGIRAADEDWVGIRRLPNGSWRATLLNRRGVGHEE